MQIGPYTVLEELARGGQGVVYRAQSPQGQVVALKLLLAHRAQSQQARQRFQAEVHALARLRHPHVVAILAAGEHEGAPWLALQFVEGESLAERLRRGPLPIHEALRTAQQLAQALSYVHSCGVLHRDLKPDNVLLRGGDALLTDFGLVLDQQSDQSRITVSGIFQGSPGYWAPEQARGDVHAHGPVTDVYGFGGVLYACLTGQAPIQADSLQEYLQTFRFRSTPAPRELRPEVSVWLSELCLRCLAVEATERPASADAVARELVLAGGTGSAAEAPRTTGLVLGLAGAAVAAIGAAAVAVSLLVSPGEPSTPPEPDAPPAPSPPVGDTPDPPAELTPELEAQLEAAEQKLVAGLHAEALEDYERLVQLLPDHAPAIRNRGVTLARLARHAEALDDLGRALELEPDDVTTIHNLGFSKAELGRHAEAIADYDRALELDPDFAASYLQRGNAKAALGRYAEAIADFDQTIERLPKNALAYTNRGHAKSLLGRHAEALEDWTRAIEVDPELASAYTNRGVGLAKRGLHEDAIAHFDKALALDPSDAVAYTERATNKATLKRYAEAVEDFDAALALGYRTSRLLSNRGHSLAQQGLHERAIESFGQALELNGNDSAAITNRGVSYARLGRYARAIEDFDRALEIGPRLGITYASRGSCKAQLNRHAEAIEDFDRALELAGSKEVASQARRLREQSARALAGN